MNFFTCISIHWDTTNECECECVGIALPDSVNVDVGEGIYRLLIILCRSDKKLTEPNGLEEPY